MGTFFSSRRNQVLVALAAVIFVVLAALFLGFSARPKIGVTSTGGASVSPSPSDTTSPTPDVSPSPSDLASPSPSAAPSVAPSTAPSAAPPSSPTVTGPALTASGHELNPPSPAPADRMGSGAPCDQAWMDSGWTIDPGGCGILAIRNSDQGGSVAFVIEHMGSTPTVQRRVYLMTGTDAWHVRLAASDDTGSKYTAIAVKQGNIAGAPFPQVIVGFRINGTGQFLTYDIVDMAADGSLAVSGSRNLDHGSANISGNQLVDYTPYPNANTPDYFIRSVIGYSAGAYRITDVSHAPERGPGDLVPPP